MRGAGWGEDVMRTCCAFRCVQLMGCSPQKAVDTVARTAHETVRRHGGRPGCRAWVCMNAKDERAGAANRKGFISAVANSAGNPDVILADPALDKDEKREETQR